MRGISVGSLHIALAASMLLFGACAADPEPSAEEAVVEEASPIVQGSTDHGKWGAVEVVETGGSCSGVQIGVGMVLTSAHCFPSMGSASWSDNVSVKLRKSLVGTGSTRYYKCLSGSSTASGTCSGWATAWVRRDTFQDVAVILAPNGAWPLTEQSDNIAWGFYTGTAGPGFQFILHGRGNTDPAGTGSGPMRYVTGSLATGSATAFDWTVGTQRPCTGDSGGPYAFNSNPKWVIGVHQTSESPWDGKCAAVGKKSHGRRVTLSFKDVLNNGRWGVGLPTCTKYSAAFPDFWTCP